MAELCRLCGKDVLSRGGVDPEEIDFLNVKRGLCCLCYLRNTVCIGGEYLGLGMFGSAPTTYGRWNMRCYSYNYGTNRCIWTTTDPDIYSIAGSKTARAEPEDRMIRGEIPPYKLALP